MLSSKNLNQNMLKMHCFCFFSFFFEKKPQALLQTHAILPIPTVATIRPKFVAHKKSILINKIWGDFSAPSLCELPLHFTWSGDGIVRIHSREKEWMFLGMQDFDFAQSDSILPNKIC